MKAVLCGGGTAGHINPAVAIGETILEKETGSEIIFVGRDGGRENRAIEEGGHKLFTLDVSGIRRSLSPKNAKSILKMLKAIRESKRLLREFSPEVVIGTGGYVCYPVIKAAKALGIKTVIHESNAVAGLATRRLCRSADLILLNYKCAEKSVPAKCKTVIVGNPLRKNFSVISRQKAREKMGIRKDEILIVSFGGSIGAQRLNEACLDLMENFSLKNPLVRHIHAMGERYYVEYQNGKLKRGHNGCRVVDYINDMPGLLSCADIAITRAGALTLSELAFLGTAAILIPSPNVTGDHQRKNALALSEEGAAILIEEGEELTKRLERSVRELCKSPEKRRELSSRIKRTSVKNSRELIYEEIKKLV